MRRRTAAWIAFTTGFTLAVLSVAWWMRPHAQAAMAGGAPQGPIAPAPMSK